MKAAAHRHLKAADALNVGHSRAVAGYLYELSAECAVKAMMIEAGIDPSDASQNGPFYLHFPQLRTALLDNVTGRRGAVLARLISNSSFFSQWAIDMRYCKGEEILARWVDKWSAQARDAVGAIGT
jgi:hypothetical protein